MIYDLIKEKNLRGYTLEHLAKSILRRHKKNNFIFVTAQFDNLDEILRKYRINTTCNENSKLLNIKKFDMVEFILDNNHDRNAIKIIIYDVKSKWHTVKRDYFEMCRSDYVYYQMIKDYFEYYFISMVLLDHWKISFNIKDPKNIRVYTRNKKEKN